MKILILGGTGIISSSIVRQLCPVHDVLILNRSGNAGKTSARAVACDRSDTVKLRQIAQRESPFDCVIDMVCFLPNEAQGAIDAFAGFTKQYIFCSTVDVYTKTTGRYPITENSPKKPIESFPYAWNKARCEELLTNAHENGTLNVTIIRPAATYSELRLPLISTVDSGTFLLERALLQKPIISHNDGLSIWSECHSDDVARGFVSACGNTAAYGQAYHLTGEEWMTWDEILHTACVVIGAPEPDIIHIPTAFLREYDMEYASWCLENFRYNQIFDNQKARKALGFVYTITWDHGFREYYRQLIERKEPLEPWDSHPKYDRLISAWLNK